MVCSSCVRCKSGSAVKIEKEEEEMMDDYMNSKLKM